MYNNDELKKRYKSIVFIWLMLIAAPPVNAICGYLVHLDGIKARKTVLQHQTVFQVIIVLAVVLSFFDYAAVYFANKIKEEPPQKVTSYFLIKIAPVVLAQVAAFVYLMLTGSFINFLVLTGLCEIAFLLHLPTHHKYYDLIKHFSENTKRDY